MRNQGGFGLEFKRRLVEELLGGHSRTAQVCRRCDIYLSVVHHWRKQYSWGKLDN